MTYHDDIRAQAELLRAEKRADEFRAAAWLREAIDTGVTNPEWFAADLVSRGMIKFNNDIKTVKNK